ncbi:MAG: hypothetical protein MUE53_02010 [Chitinophagales bacterium]|jgi:hypothetical protein|nr:hypothetical protein [Chitinophagales bacterium]
MKDYQVSIFENLEEFLENAFLSSHPEFQDWFKNIQAFLKGTNALTHRYVLVQDQEKLIAFGHIPIYALAFKNFSFYLSKSHFLLRWLFYYYFRYCGFNFAVFGNMLTEHMVDFVFLDKAQDSWSEIRQSIICKLLQEKALKLKGVIDTFSSNNIETKNWLIFRTDNNLILNDLGLFQYDFDQYKAALSSKYRVRLNQIYKLNEQTHIINISNLNINQYKSKISSLYAQTLNRSKFNLNLTKHDYLTHLLDIAHFKIRGFEIEGQLVGFMSYFDLANVLEIHHTGFSNEVNQNVKLYNYMLYDMLEIAFENQKSTINFKKTADEIKSTLGASPQEDWYQIYLTNSIFRLIAKVVLSKRLTQEYIIRKPFKTSQK